MIRTKRAVFRSTIIALLLVVFSALPASAHPYVYPNTIAVNKTSSLLFTVNSESNTAMTGLKVSIPAQFKISSVTPPSGWKVTHETSPIELSGPGIAPGSNAVFNVAGIPSQRERLQIDVTTIAEDGTTVAWDGTNLRQPQYVTVVTKVTQPSEPTPVWVYFIPSVVVIAIAGAIILFMKRREAK